MQRLLQDTDGITAPMWVEGRKSNLTRQINRMDQMILQWTKRARRAIKWRQKKFIEVWTAKRNSTSEFLEHILSDKLRLSITDSRVTQRAFKNRCSNSVQIYRAEEKVWRKDTACYDLLRKRREREHFGSGWPITFSKRYRGEQTIWKTLVSGSVSQKHVQVTFYHRTKRNIKIF